LAAGSSPAVAPPSPATPGPVHRVGEPVRPAVGPIPRSNESTEDHHRLSSSSAQGGKDKPKKKAHFDAAAAEAEEKVPHAKAAYARNGSDANLAGFKNRMKHYFQRQQ
jgi:hypothetical protein